MSCNSASPPRYVLVTAAHNEEAFIEKTILSIVSQTWLPAKWVIVNDGSTDSTSNIVKSYALKHNFIELLDLVKSHAPDFGAQVKAINNGCDLLRRTDVAFDFIGNVDSDISFGGSYFCDLLRKFEADPALGLAGGWLYERRKTEFEPRQRRQSGSVPHGIQLFRRACFEQIGGYVPLRYGAPDWCAEVSARMHGWRIESFPDVPAFHHRLTGNVSGRLRYLYRSGLSAYSLGSHPLFEIAKCIVRLRHRPYVVGALSRLTGFVVGYCRQEERQVPFELVRFLRSEQIRKLHIGRQHGSHHQN